MRHFLLGFIVLFFLTTKAEFSQKNTVEKTIIPDTTVEALNLNDYTYLFATGDSSLTLAQIPDSAWKYSPKGAVFGVADKIYWVKYDFDNRYNQAKEFILYFPYHHISKINVFFKQSDTLIRHISATGTFYSYAQKDIKSRSYPVKIKLPPGKSSIIVKLEHRYLPLRGTAFLLNFKKVKDVIMQNETIIWFWKGIFIFALLVSLVLWLSTKIKLFLYYLILNAGIAVFIGMELGDYFMLFDADPHNAIIDIKHMGNVIVVMFFPLFLNELTPIALIHPKLWKRMNILIWVMPLLWLICLFPAMKNSYVMYGTVTYYILISAVVFLLQLYLLFVAALKKYKNSLVLVIIYFFYIAAVMLSIILPNLGYKGDDLFVYKSVIYGSVFEIFTFMVLMGNETLGVYKERAFLLEKQKEHQAEVIKAIVESQEIERNKVGRELHDMIGANISVIKQNIDKTNTNLLTVIESTVESVRALSHGLVTPLIQEDDFIDEIKELCIMFSTDNLRITAYFHNWDKINNPEIATHLYRIIQELLQNAVKHSKAKNISIQFLIDNKQGLSIMYEDDGQGFSYLESRKKGRGLINIENRVKLINGKIHFDTQYNRKGTTIIIEVNEINQTPQRND